MQAICQPSGVNLRIAREVPGCADALVPLACAAQGLLLCGAPGSGKTTLLRDLTRQLCSGFAGRYYKAAVIDERGALSAMEQGVPQCDLGFTSDVLFGYPKAEGMEQAVRTLSPDFLICDEIASQEELQAVLYALGSGVRTIATVHAGSLRELAQRQIGRALLASGGFDWAVQLCGMDSPCRIAARCRCAQLLEQEVEACV